MKSFMPERQPEPERSEEQINRSLEVVMRVAEEIDKAMWDRCNGNCNNHAFIDVEHAKWCPTVILLNKLYTKYYERV